MLLPHILFMFLAVLFGIRVGLGALTGQQVRDLTLATVGLMSVDGLILGPVVQKQAFGAYWTGIPFGYDLTDHKTVISPRGSQLDYGSLDEGIPARGAVSTG